MSAVPVNLDSVIKTRKVASISASELATNGMSGFKRMAGKKGETPHRWLLQELQHPQSEYIQLDTLGLSDKDKTTLCKRAAAGDEAAIAKLTELKEFVQAMFSELRIITEYVYEQDPVTGEMNKYEVTRPYHVPPPYRSKIAQGQNGVRDGKSSDIIDRIMDKFEEWFAQSLWFNFRDVTVDHNITRETREDMCEQIRISQAYVDAQAWAAKKIQSIRSRIEGQQREMEFQRQQAAEEGKPMPDPDLQSEDPFKRAGLKELKSWTAIISMNVTLAVKYCRALDLRTEGTLNQLHARIAGKLGIEPKAPRTTPLQRRAAASEQAESMRGRKKKRDAEPVAVAVAESEAE